MATNSDVGEVIEKETDKMMSKKRKVQDVDQGGFKYNKKGKMTKKELNEIKNTHANVMDWVRKEKAKVAEKESFEKVIRDEPDWKDEDLLSTHVDNIATLCSIMTDVMLVVMRCSNTMDLSRLAWSSLVVV